MKSARLSYGNEPLVLCSIVRTAAWKNLLELFTATYPIVKKRITSLQMVLNCGLRVPPDFVQTPDGVKIVGYIPNLYRHMGAARASFD